MIFNNGNYIIRTDEGQPRPKNIFNKCGTNIYTFLHHHNWVLHIKQIYSSTLGPKNLWNNKTNLWFKSWFWIIQWTWNTTMDPFHLISWFSATCLWNILLYQQHQIHTRLGKCRLPIPYLYRSHFHKCVIVQWEFFRIRFF